RVESAEMPEGRIQILTHHTEHTVWQPRWVTHPNGAFGLASMTIVVADVGEAAARFTRFSGRAAKPSPSGQSIALDRGLVELVGADAFAQMLPQIPIPSVPFLGPLHNQGAIFAGDQYDTGRRRHRNESAGRGSSRALPRGPGAGGVNIHGVIGGIGPLADTSYCAVMSACDSKRTSALARHMPASEPNVLRFPRVAQTE